MTAILGIESSCDETSAGVVEMEGSRVLSNVIASQHSVHAKFGGVVPELASRQHLSVIMPVIRQALDSAGLTLARLDGIAVTSGPGLAGSLLVGLETAKALAYACSRPLIGVNHLEGHLYSGFLCRPAPAFPFLGLVVSGGHTSLYAVSSAWEHRLLASTRDDAAGEAYDKVAKVCGLGYPGGPALDRAAAGHTGPAVHFPRAAMKDGSLDFSFSGLKTSVLVHVEGLRRAGQDPDMASVAAGFQVAATEAVIEKTLKAADQEGLRQVVLGGGVAANSRLRTELPRRAGGQGLEVFIPPVDLCADNGAMIAYAGGLRLSRGERSGWDLGVEPGWKY
jgi:N6-L-threonylcarbamoyladenine synthase